MACAAWLSAAAAAVDSSSSSQAAGAGRQPQPNGHSNVAGCRLQRHQHGAHSCCGLRPWRGRNLGWLARRRLMVMAWT